MRNTSALALALSLLCAVPNTGAAQGAATVDPLLGRTVLVVPVSDDAVGSAAARAHLEHALRSLEFVPRDVEEAGDRFEERFSRPAPRLSDTARHTFDQSSEAAAAQLAERNYDAALAALDEAQEIARRHADELNRERRQAIRVLDTCLYMVRSLLQTQGEEAARARVRECRELVPRSDPSGFRHPPEVITLLREHDAALDARADALVTITSFPDRCLLRLNGLEVGHTPTRLDTLSPGPYRVQVECRPDERGRVHTVTLDSGENRVHVDVHFDRELRSRPILHFDPAGSPARRVAHAHALARAFEHPVLVHEIIDTSSARLLWVDPGGPRAQVVYSSFLDPVVALRALREGRSEDLRSDPPSAIEPPALPPAPTIATPAEVAARDAAAAEGERSGELTPAPTIDRLPLWRRVLGWSLVGVGAVSLLSVPALQAERSTRGDRYVIAESVDPDFLARQNRWENMGLGVYFASAGGALASIAGIGIAAPRRERVPVAAWISGGIGIAGASAAIALGALAPGGCENVAEDRRSCVDRGQVLGWTAMSASAASVLLSVPLVYLVERGHYRLDVDTAVAGAGGALRLSGTF